MKKKQAVSSKRNGWWMLVLAFAILASLGLYAKQYFKSEIACLMAEKQVFDGSKQVMPKGPTSTIVFEGKL